MAVVLRALTVYSGEGDFIWIRYRLHNVSLCC